MCPTANDFPAPAGYMIAKALDNGKVAGSSTSSAGKDTQLVKRTDPVKSTSAKQKGKQAARGPSRYVAVREGVQAGAEENEQTRQRNQYYGNAFAYKGSHLSPRDRVHGDSIITAEFRTNIIVSDEYTFMINFSDHLAQRFQRPRASIVISFNHSACLLFGASFDPAYILTITALQDQVQTTTNKRNIALIQSFIAKALNVPSDRGIVRFVGVAEDDLGTRGMTVLGEIESLSRVAAKGRPDENVETIPESTGTNMKPGRRKYAENETISKPPPRQTMAHLPGSQEPRPAPPIPAMPTEKSSLDIQAQKVQRMGKRKSFLQMFGK